MKAWAIVIGAGCASATVPHDRPDPWFDPDRVLEVDITMAPADWSALRGETRSWVQVYDSCLSAPFPSPFTWFDASVTVDGEPFHAARVRKKGFLGSLSVDKPSLKVKLPDAEDLTLDNAAQDPAYVRQCLAFRAFAAAGVPAPRCSYAHVRVDGEDLGVFVHVEAIGQRFLAEHFDDDGGDLYQGTYSDFRDGWTATFDGRGDRADLAAVTAALQAPDDSLAAALDPIVDLDEVFRFWAVETLVTDRDGYSSDANNFDVYDDGRLVLLPWGPDATFVDGADPFGDGVVSVQARSQLPWRLYGVPDTRARYLDTLRDLLAHAWHEPALEAAIDHDAVLLAPYVWIEPAALDEVRRSVDQRRGAIERELAAGPPAWTEPPRAPPCFDTIGAVSGTLATATGTGTLAATIDGVALDVRGVGASAGPDPGDPTRDRWTITAALADGTSEVVVFSIDPARLVAGASVPIDWIAASAVVYRYDGAYAQVGLIPSGTLTITQAGATIAASFSGPVVKSPF